MRSDLLRMYSRLTCASRPGLATTLDRDFVMGGSQGTQEQT